MFFKKLFHIFLGIVRDSDKIKVVFVFFFYLIQDWYFIYTRCAFVNQKLINVGFPFKMGNEFSLSFKPVNSVLGSTLFINSVKGSFTVFESFISKLMK